MRWLHRLFNKGGSQSLGQRGEQAAAKFLKRKGYKIVARGPRYRRGELDIVAVDNRTVVFVEVKTCRHVGGESPLTAIDEKKQHNLTRAAMLFMKMHGLMEHAARFDAIAVTWPKGDKKPTIEHIENAFEPTGENRFFG